MVLPVKRLKYVKMMNDDEQYSQKSISFESCCTLWISGCKLWCTNALGPIGTSAHPPIYLLGNLATPDPCLTTVASPGWEYDPNIPWLHTHTDDEQKRGQKAGFTRPNPNHYVDLEPNCHWERLPATASSSPHQHHSCPRHSDKASNSKTSWSMRDLATLLVGVAISFPQHRYKWVFHSFHVMGPNMLQTVTIRTYKLLCMMPCIPGKCQHKV